MSHECEHPTNPVWKSSCLERDLSFTPVFLCFYVGVQVRGLQGLYDPEMSSWSQ